MADLFCGRGGATKGFQAEGWQCDGFDLNPQPLYPGRFHQRDILTMTADDIHDYDFAWASSPCEEFSVHCMKHFHPNPKHPEMGIRLFEHTRNILEQSGVPYVMENVRCAQKFVGQAVNHCGPFYLWGNAVPAVFPRDTYQVKKGFQTGGGIIQKLKAVDRKALTDYRRLNDLSWSSSKSAKRKEFTAKAAEIPLAISQYIAQTRTFADTRANFHGGSTSSEPQAVAAPKQVSLISE